ncbi:MAG: hypothetical protein LBQ22_13095 [Bacteroidales bacterium]|jgi:hypothetical protein|nr:hypothetical protein [Bacteroidales bacterium]
MSEKTKYEVYQFQVTGATTNIEIDRNIDKRYTKVTDIFIYTSSVVENNKNLEFSKDLRIDDKIVYPQNFDSFMLYPMMQNQEFTKLREPISINSSKIEGELKLGEKVDKDCSLKIVLKLEM